MRNVVEWDSLILRNPETNKEIMIEVRLDNVTDEEEELVKKTTRDVFNQLAETLNGSD